MPVETTDFRAIAIARSTGELSHADADALHAARLVFVLKTVSDGLKFQAWKADRSFAA